MIAGSILELVGNTPTVRINHLNPNPKLEMYLKLEMFNPGGSVKDRIAKYMIEHAEKEGALTKGKTEGRHTENRIFHPFLIFTVILFAFSVAGFSLSYFLYLTLI